FDVGAHWGESIEFFCSLFETPRIFSFEPDPDSFKRVLNTLAQYSGCEAFNIALSESPGRSSFFRSSLSHLNSLSPINLLSRDHIRLVQSANSIERDEIVKEFNHEISVVCETLDSFVRNQNIEHIDLLKLDVQGGEAQVLRGATSAITNVGVLVVEISLFDFYETRTTFGEIEKYLPSTFKLHSLLEVSNNPANGRTDWVDALYVNSDFQRL
ncbi:MAG: FkbM family methyltransferase, partial [Pseudomonadales bacterium]